MKIDNINNKYNTAKPLFKGDRIGPVAYPEFYDAYVKSSETAANSDSVSSNPLTAFVNKVAVAYRLIFKPELGKTGNDIQHGIDILFDLDKEGKILDQIA